MNIKSILNESAGFEKVLRKEAKGLVAKWKKTGLLEGISSEIEISNMAQLLENQAKQLVTEANATTIGSNGEEWNGVALPLVRRIFSEIAAKEFVSVQPMNLPSGLVFYLDFKYGTGQPGFTTGSGKDSQADSVFGITETANQASGGLYGAGRFGYTINDDVTTSQTIGAAPAAGTVTTSSVTAADYNYDTAWSASNAGQTWLKYTVATAAMTRPDLEGVRAFTISGSNITTFYPQFTTINSADTQISFICRAVAASAATNAVVRYQKQPTDAARGDFETTKAGMELNPETDINIPELNIEMRSVPIVAKTRKLKAQWTPEFAQDLNAYHSIDAEAELTALLSEYVSMEIDLEILDMLNESVTGVTTEAWSAQIGTEFTKTVNNTTDVASFTRVVNASPNRTAYVKSTWFQTLGNKIQKVSNKIHQLTLRGGANFLVCSPDVATILESIPGYVVNTDGDQAKFAMGVSRVGSFASRFQVYKNPYMTDNAILVGFRGSNFLETGAVYAPYIPLIQTPLVYDPVNFTPRRGVMTRYAKKVVRPEFYGKVLIADLDTV